MKKKYILIILLISFISLYGCTSSIATVSNFETESSLEDLIANENTNDNDSTTEDSIDNSKESDSSDSNSTSKSEVNDTKPSNSNKLDNDLNETNNNSSSTETSGLGNNNESNSESKGDVNETTKNEEITTESSNSVKPTEPSTEVSNIKPTGDCFGDSDDYDEEYNDYNEVESSGSSSTVGGTTITNGVTTDENGNIVFYKEYSHKHIFETIEEKSYDAYTYVSSVEYEYFCRTCNIKIDSDCVICPNCNEEENIYSERKEIESYVPAKYFLYDRCIDCGQKFNYRHEERNE